MADSVFVVFSECCGGGYKVFALCPSRRSAQRLRSRVAKGKKRVRGQMQHFDAEPSNPYACAIEISPVQLGVLFPKGELPSGSGNSNEKEIIK